MRAIFVFKGDKTCLTGSCAFVRIASPRPNKPLPIPTAESAQKLPVKLGSESTLVTETVQKLPVSDSTDGRESEVESESTVASETKGCFPTLNNYDFKYLVKEHLK